MTPDDQKTIDEAQRQLKTHLQSPVAWMEMAQTLRHAADVLEHRIHLTLDDGPQTREAYDRRMRRKRLDRPAQMLYQMSYENALKGILALRGGLVKPYAATHDLTLLCKGVALDLHPIEADHMANLTRMNQLGRFRLSSKEDFGTRWNSDDWRFREEIDAKIKAAWSDGGGEDEMGTLPLAPLFDED